MGGSLLPHLNIFDSGNFPSLRHQRPLIIPTGLEKPQPRLATRIVCRFYLTRLDHISLPLSPVRDSSLTVLEREQAKAAAAGVPTPISSSPPSKHWWPGGEKGWTNNAGWGCMLRTGQ